MISAFSEVLGSVFLLGICAALVLGWGAVLNDAPAPPVFPSTPRNEQARRSCPRQSTPRVGSTEGRAQARSVR